MSQQIFDTIFHRTVRAYRVNDHLDVGWVPLKFPIDRKARYVTLAWICNCNIQIPARRPKLVANV